MNIDSVLGDLEDSDPITDRFPILEELNRLDERAFEMALVVSRDPTQRARLKEEAVSLTQRLDGLVEELEKNQPELYDQVADQVSESILDLSFVELESDIVSLRLGRLLL